LYFLAIVALSQTARRRPTGNLFPARTITAIPEPSSILALVAAAGLGRVAWRRQSRKAL
jgi:hypothetical protein